MTRLMTLSVVFKSGWFHHCVMADESAALPELQTSVQTTSP